MQQHHQPYRMQQQSQQRPQQQQQQDRQQPPRQQPQLTIYPSNFVPAKGQSQGGASITNGGNSMRSFNTLSPNANLSRSYNWHKSNYAVMSQNSKNPDDSIVSKSLSAISLAGQQHRPTGPDSKPQFSKLDASSNVGSSSINDQHSASSATISCTNSTPVSGAPFLRKKVVPKRSDRNLNNNNNIKELDSETDNDTTKSTLNSSAKTEEPKANDTKDKNLVQHSTIINLDEASVITDHDVVILDTIDHSKKSNASRVHDVQLNQTPAEISTDTPAPKSINNLSESLDPADAMVRAIIETDLNSSEACERSGLSKTMPDALLAPTNRSSDAKKSIPDPSNKNAAFEIGMEAKLDDDKSQSESKSRTRIESVPQNQTMPNAQIFKQKTLEAPKQTWRAKYFSCVEPSVSSFSWEQYLQLLPAEPAPKEAFMQAYPPPENKFALGMKLEAKDPRNPVCWCLAHIVASEGMMLRLRFDGADSMNDMFELIDSPDIRAIGTKPEEQLLPPMAYRSNLSTYPKFVEKVLSNPQTNIAPPEIFPPKPPRPKKNLFKEGMKLEALDRRQRNWIGPATISKVIGNKVTVDLDGWNKDTYSYTCEYDSRNLFPINWCRDTRYTIEPPKNWDSIVKGDFSDHSGRTTPNLKTASRKSTLTNPMDKSITQQETTKDKSRMSQASATLTKKQKINRTTKEKIEISKISNQSHVKSEGPKQNGGAIWSDNNTVKKSPSSLVTSKVAKVSVSQDVALELSSSLVSDNDDDEEGDHAPDMSDRFSCQRTISFADWHKRKLKMLDHDIQLSATDQLRSNSSSFNMGDRLSQASTTSFPEHKEPGNSSFVDDSRTTKRPKLDTSSSDTVSRNKRKEIIASKPSSLSLWTVKDVLDLISVDETLAKYSTVFTEHEIDGKAFVLLTTDVMINHLGLKIGPVLKINDLIEQVRYSR